MESFLLWRLYHHHLCIQGAKVFCLFALIGQNVQVRGMYFRLEMASSSDPYEELRAQLYLQCVGGVTGSEIIH